MLTANTSTAANTKVNTMPGNMMSRLISQSTRKKPAKKKPVAKKKKAAKKRK